MSANRQLRDALLEHDAGLARLSNATARRFIALLNQSEEDLVKQIRARLGWIANRGYDASDFTLRRLEANLREIRGVLKEAYRAAGIELRRELVDVGRYELELGGRVLERASFGMRPIRIPDPTVISAIVNSRPFQGGLLRDWTRRLEANAAARVSQALRMGLLTGETIDQLVRRVVGTRRAGWTDGILEISRRDAATIVQTAAQHVVNSARDDLWQVNDDLVKAVQWVGTLDSRTCPECRIRDGRLYDLRTHRPIDHTVPWGAGPGRLHFNDRCTSVPVLKSWRELGIDRDDAPPGVRASMDGQVPETLTYLEWLRQQPSRTVEEVLGPTRAALFQSGRVEIAEFFDAKGSYLTLEELRAQEGVETLGKPRDVVPPVPARVELLAREHHDARAQQYAEFHGLDVDDAVAELQALVKEQVESSEVFIRVHDDDLPNILRDGRLKSQFESGTSSGYFNPTFRSNFEEGFFGVPRGNAPAGRPIYGYLAQPDRYAAQRGLDHYGTVVLRLKKNVRPRVSFTRGDSLDYNADRPVTVPSRLTNPDWRAWHWPGWGDPEGNNLLLDGGSGDFYTEAQIFGGVKLSDIEEIVILGGYLSPETLAELKALGIKVRRE